MKGSTCAGAAVEGFGAALFERAEHVAVCNTLQDRVNTILTVGHAAVLGACGQGARVHLVPDSAHDPLVRLPDLHAWELCAAELRES